jgi:methionine sulfoxide reductase heme-binding subunit
MNDKSLSAYIIAVVIALVFLLLAAIISTAIKFEGGSRPKDPGKRKMWFWIFAVLCPLVVFLYGFLLVRPGINVPSLQDKYMTALGISTGIALILYILVGFILSKAFKHGKLGNWF